MYTGSDTSRNVSTRTYSSVKTPSKAVTFDIFLFFHVRTSGRWRVRPLFHPIFLAPWPPLPQDIGTIIDKHPQPPSPNAQVPQLRVRSALTRTTHGSARPKRSSPAACPGTWLAASPLQTTAPRPLHGLRQGVRLLRGGQRVGLPPRPAPAQAHASCRLQAASRARQARAGGLSRVSVHDHPA